MIESKLANDNDNKMWNVLTELMGEQSANRFQSQMASDPYVDESVSIVDSDCATGCQIVSRAAYLHGEIVTMGQVLLPVAAQQNATADVVEAINNRLVDESLLFGSVSVSDDQTRTLFIENGWFSLPMLKVQGAWKHWKEWLESERVSRWKICDLDLAEATDVQFQMLKYVSNDFTSNFNGGVLRTLEYFQKWISKQMDQEGMRLVTVCNGEEEIQAFLAIQLTETSCHVLEFQCKENLDQQGIGELNQMLNSLDLDEEINVEIQAGCLCHSLQERIHSAMSKETGQNQLSSFSSSTTFGVFHDDALTGTIDVSRLIWTSNRFEDYIEEQECSNALETFSKPILKNQSFSVIESPLDASTITITNQK
eukprot:TRINITY_DN4003_c0_g1_i1.p1 TRINITY_DN4003_c0_g1~~TRINITY_DN4003_c0_g1_i1.p1  ORF type:complete len:367 (+),score=101.72 TRINITY_DN4003_c0_g1_i1:596-1696(+)